MKLVMSVVLLLAIATAAWADDKADVAATIEKWAAAFASDDPAAVLALYDTDAVLWGTISPTRRETSAALREYFVGAFKALPGHRVTLGNRLIRVYGNVAINTGYYTFSYMKDGQPATIPTRYSFVYLTRGGRWLIVDHHSSAVPAAPMK